MLSLFVFPPVKDMYDYQGRSYLHVPQDVGINLRSADAPDKCYLPKKQIHVWSGHTKVSGKEHGSFVFLFVHKLPLYVPVNPAAISILCAGFADGEYYSVVLKLF